MCHWPVSGTHRVALPSVVCLAVANVRHRHSAGCTFTLALSLKEEGIKNPGLVSGVLILLSNFDWLDLHRDGLDLGVVIQSVFAQLAADAAARPVSVVVEMTMS